MKKHRWTIFIITTQFNITNKLLQEKEKRLSLFIFITKKLIYFYKMIVSVKQKNLIISSYECKKRTVIPFPCPAGTYAPEGQSSCINCDLGKFGAQEKQSTCTTCAKGKYRDSRGQKYCEDCPINTYSELEGNTARAQCEQCALSFAPNTVTVAPGQISNAACICRKSYFQNQNAEGTICSKCPEGGACPLPNTSISSLNTAPGYWRYGKTDTRFHKCLAQTHCVGSVNSSVATMGSDAQCRTGHTKVLCAVCLDGYKMMNNVCEPCQASDSSIIIPIVITFIILVLFLLVYFIWSAQAISKKDNFKFAERVDDASQHMGTINIIIGFLQIFSALDMTMGVPWPVDFKFTINIVQFINVDFITVLSKQLQLCGYVIPFFINFMIYMMFIPALILASYIATGLALLIYRTKDMQALITIYRRCRMKVLCMAMFLLYPSIGSKVFQLFICINVGDRSFLKVDMKLECNVGEHDYLTVVGMIFFMIYIVGIPLFSLHMLWKNKSHLFNRESKKHEEIREELGTLYMQYKKSFWYWELLEMARKVFLTGVIAIIGGGKSIQVIVALLVQFFHVLAITKFAPYENFRDNCVQFIASIQLFFTLMAALVIKLRATSLSEPMDPNEKSISGILLIVINSSVILSGLISLFLGTSKGEKCIERLNKKKELSKKRVTIIPTNKDFSINPNDILKQNDVSTVEVSGPKKIQMSTSLKPVSKKNRRMSMVSETLNSWKNENISLTQHAAKEQAARHARLLERLKLSAHDSKRKKPSKKLQEDTSLDLH